jgi:hypothetical protein
MAENARARKAFERSFSQAPTQASDELRGNWFPERLQRNS